MQPLESAAVLGAGPIGLMTVILLKMCGAGRVFSVEPVAHRREMAQASGADVVIDVVGGAFTEAAVRATAWRGRDLVIGFAAGDIPRVPANLLLLKGCELSGVFWDEFLRREPDACHTQVAAILNGIADGTLVPPIHGRYTIEQAGEALKVLAERRVTGKLLICPGR